MVLHFSINFKTTFGQNLFIIGSIPELGAGDTSKAVPLGLHDSFNWEKEIKLSSIQERIISYRYMVKCDDGTSFYEVGNKRTLGLNSGSKDIYLRDEWQGNTPIAPFLTTPFADIFFSHKGDLITPLHSFSKELIIRVTAPCTEKDAVICIGGDDPRLGGWDPEKALPMTPVYCSKWEIHLPADKLAKKISYKFIKKTRDAVIWETFDNRELVIPTLKNHDTFSVEHSAAGFHIPAPKFYGTAIPVFALRSKNSCGIGDFSDLKLMADWAASTGQNIIQVLPINDTTSTGSWTDSYPYGGITVMALHPIYLNIKEVGPFKDKADTAKFQKERLILNALKQIDYEKVLDFKRHYTAILFEQYSEDIFAEPEFYTFYKNNKSWLLPYCAFCTLRDEYGTADFSKWGKHSKFTPELAEKLYKKGSKSHYSMSLNIFIQYLLDKQLKEAVAYAHSKGVAIKGDIPIGITPHSVEAWSEPSYFNMSSQAGAPPDDFSVNGQNWGFPTYNWDEMAKDHYSWWKNRFEKMSCYFDAYRIDHVLGFFRIWEIPVEQTKGLMGHFNPALPYSYDELRQNGFPFYYERHAKPYIRYYMLQEMFGDKVRYVMDTFLDSPAYEVFTLKPEFDTQRKIEDFFRREDSPVKEALEALVSEVLFVEDPKRKGYFHPRISAQYTYSFKALSFEEQRVFNNIYDHFFYHRHNGFWREQALKKLPELISATNMLTCAEDLGMIPACVPDVMCRLRMLTLEIQRMPKDPTIRFADPRWYPYMSVCTTGTHDTSTLRGWWLEDPDKTQEYYNVMLREEGPAPKNCESWICEKILRAHISGGSIFTILPLQDWLSMDEKLRATDIDSERINIPAITTYYWRYRMHLTLEDLIAAKSFNLKLKEIITEK